MPGDDLVVLTRQRYRHHQEFGLPLTRVSCEVRLLPEGVVDVRVRVCLRLTTTALGARATDFRGLVVAIHASEATFRHTIAQCPAASGAGQEVSDRLTASPASGVVGIRHPVIRHAVGYGGGDKSDRGFEHRDEHGARGSPSGPLLNSCEGRRQPARRRRGRRSPGPSRGVNFRSFATAGFMTAPLALTTLRATRPEAAPIASR